MSRYHFHLRVGPCRAIDTKGIECADRLEAVFEAMLLILDKCRTTAVRNARGRIAAIEVCDDAGKLEFSIPFSRLVSSGETGAARRFAA